ncbi:hypothetical protein K0M31_012299 [Melipona bicolor]|uniref:Uncharacterized protein n=1 Tax=Melipona bicolor TaxID=60889 RepID=A0AA40FJK5_9HYME|nr:hypothetical protein K0M31_012299 [Melipona bicolor]
MYMRNFAFTNHARADSNWSVPIGQLPVWEAFMYPLIAYEPQICSIVRSSNGWHPLVLGQIM